MFDQISDQTREQCRDSSISRYSMAGATINSLERSDVSWNEKHQPNSIGELAVSSPKVSLKPVVEVVDFLS